MEILQDVQLLSYECKHDYCQIIKSMILMLSGWAYCNKYDMVSGRNFSLISIRVKAPGQVLEKKYFV